VNDYTAATYGDRIAESYDRMYPGGGGVEPSVNVLAKLAGGGRALELGIGTGRVALPLAERGVTVQGIDASQAMVDRLRAKPGGDAIPVTIGDFAEFQVDSRFELIFVVCNTLFGLATQDAQVQCFQRVAEHLAAGGTFLIEAFVPDPARFVGGRNLSVTGIEPDLVTLDVARHDAANQRVYSQHLLLTEAGTRLYPVQLRYAWPSEPDLMARLAGLRLRDRWSGWDGAPFTAASGSHISVYERAPDPPA
jgi:SAM-dependent methyltransferase